MRADESESKTADRQAQKDDDYSLMKVFVDTFDQVQRNYVKDVDRRELLQAAIEGMMSKLDPYSSYISPDEMARFSEAVDQEFGGIGIQVHQDEPADRAGRDVAASGNARLSGRHSCRRHHRGD